MFRSSLIFILSLLAFGASACGSSPAAATQAAVSAPTATPKATEERVTFISDGLKLVGYLYTPAGNGPFPAIVWNHGSAENLGEGSAFDAIADAFVPEGYVVFAPVRRGEAGSEGESIQDEIREERSVNGDAAAQVLFAKLMDTEQLDDQLAGLAYLKSLPFVDARRIATMGCADGGVQAIFGAAANAGYRSAVALSPASDDWTGNQPLQNSLVAAVSRIHIPVMLIHPSADITKDPGTTLAAQLESQGKPYRLSIHDPVGTPSEQTECFGGPSGVEAWQGEVQNFLRDVMQ